MLGEIIAANRRRSPLVHCITNYVTANDCANILLACGASAIMADDLDEAAEVTTICDGLVLNLGTPNPRRLEAMARAGEAAACLGHPIILDPVGVGCSGMRRNAAQELLSRLPLAAIRGNASEIAMLARGETARRGVDADAQAGGAAALEAAVQLAQSSGAVVVLTGDRDIVTDGRQTYRVDNGHPMMKRVTGCGCQLSALLGAYIAAAPEQKLTAALAAVCAMGYSGEIAHRRLIPGDGNAGYRNYIIDAIFNLTPEELEKGARYEIYQ